MSPQHEAIEQFTFSDYKEVRHCRKRLLLKERRAKFVRKHRCAPAPSSSPQVLLDVVESESDNCGQQNPPTTIESPEEPQTTTDPMFSTSASSENTMVEASSSDDYSMTPEEIEDSFCLEVS